jgi:hypothetical protein
MAATLVVLAGKVAYDRTESRSTRVIAFSYCALDCS